MRTGFRLLSALVIVVTSAALVASCGGGNNGSGGSGGGTLRLQGAPSFGIFNLGSGVEIATSPFNVLNPLLNGMGNQVNLVGPSDFPAAQPGQGHFVQLQFSGGVMASSVRDTTQSGASGIVIQDSNGINIDFFLDESGAIDASNTFPAADTTPDLVRLYIENPASPGSARPLTPGQYTVSIIETNLRGSNGQQFCIMSNCGSNTATIYSFSVGGDMTPIAGAPTGAALPQVNAVIPVNQEFRLFFSEAVDFQSVAGLDLATGTVNVTQLDQFASVPLPLNNNGANGENIAVNYTPPAGTVLPANYGFIVYMPDPFHNPTEVRLRFCDINLAQPSDTMPNTQNYGIPAAVWNSFSMPAPVNNAGQTLALPPTLPVPGSNTTGGNAMLTLTVFSSGNGSASDSSSTGDGVVGVTDRARNALANDITLNYNYQSGPLIANNPSPPDLHIAVSANKLVPISGATVTSNSLSVASGGTVTGQLSGPMPNGAHVVLDDPSVLGRAIDMEFGSFVNRASGLNFIHNAPRRLTFPAPPPNNNGDPGVPFPVGTQPELCYGYLIGILACPPPPALCPIPPLGVNLYVVDEFDQNQVKVFDSNTFTLLTTLPAQSPRGLGIAPDLSHLYVSNFDQGTIQRWGANPLVSLQFHQLMNTVTVGPGPTAISVQPENEDLFVVISGNNAIAKVNVALQQFEETFPTGLGPRDIFIDRRMICMGCTLAYTAFITNFFDNSVSVFESDSPVLQLVNQNGPNGRMIDTLFGFDGPEGGCWNRYTFSGLAQVALGAWIVNTTGSSVQNMGMVNFSLGPQPGFMGPPPFRTIINTGTVGTNTLAGSPGDATIENLSALSAPPLVGDNKILAGADLGQGQGIPSVMVVTYPAAGQVASFDLVNGAIYGTIDAPGSAIYSYYDQ